MIKAHRLRFKKKNNQWRWQIKASNGKIIDSSTESFKNKKDCISNCKSTAMSIFQYFLDDQ